MYSYSRRYRGNQKQRHKEREKNKRRKEVLSAKQETSNKQKGLTDYFTYDFDLCKREKLSKYFVMT